jgi:aminocarboxymuconate-semialdehyde decarboxylase
MKMEKETRMAKIDIHTHIYPEDYWKAIVKISERITFPVDVRRIITYYANKGVLTKAEDTIGVMEKFGIGIQVPSLSIPNVYMPDPAMSLDLAEMANDAYSEIRRKFPEKFYVLASVPLNFPDLAIKELDRAINKLRMNGVVLGSNIAGKPLSSPKFFPFYERANELKLPILIHPMSPPHMEEEDEFFTGPLVHYLFESTLAATKMVFAGVFERFPNIRLILPHLGGAIPYIQGRIDSGYRNHPACRKNISKLPSEYFREFYYDTVSFNVPALRCALEIVGPEHVVYGTDFPFQPVESIAMVNENLERLKLSPEALEAIEGKNLLRILLNP